MSQEAAGPAEGEVRGVERDAREVVVSVIAATIGASPALASSLAVIAAETRGIGPAAEILLAATPTRPHPIAEIRAIAEPLGLQVLECPARGKARALTAAVGAARGQYLVFVDADVRPLPGAFARLIEALEAGADVVSPRRVVAVLWNPGPVARILRGWSVQWTEMWHTIRVRSDAHLWSVSGELFAMRRWCFPGQIPVPLVDDASIGSAAKGNGARFVYVPGALTEFVPPATLHDWFRQKVRTRRGMTRLARIEPRVFALRRAQRQAVLASRRHRLPSKVVVVGQEGVVLALATLLDRFGPPPDHWTEIETTKQWGRTLGRDRAGSAAPHECRPDRVKVFVVAGKDPTWEVGGHGSYVRAHCRALKALGFTPEVFAVAERTRTRVTEYGRVHLVRSPSLVFGLRSRGAPVDVPLLANALVREALRRRGPVLFHGFSFWGLAGITAAAKLRRLGRDAVAVTNVYTTTEHERKGIFGGLKSSGASYRRWRRYSDREWYRRVVTPIERRAYEESALLVVNYDSVASIVREEFPAAAPFLRLSYASERAFTHPASLAERRSGAPIRVVTVARHDPRKGLHVLIEALRLLVERGIEVSAVLVGDGPMIEAHREMVRRGGLADSVHIVGYVEDPGEALAAADVFVLPSIEEGSGSVAVLEALEAGLPVVATDCDGLREDVDDGVSGLLVAPGDPAQLAGAIERLSADTALRAQMGTAARRRFESRFSPEAMCRDLSRVYASLGFAADA